MGSVELLDTHREGAFAVRHFAPAEPAGVEPKVKSEVKQSENRKQDTSMQENDSACELDENAAENAKEQMSAVIALRLFRPPLGASVTLREAKPVRMRCLEREGNCRRNRLDRRPLALFRRLVGTGRLVARGVGHRRTRRNWTRVVPLSAGQTKRKLVCRRNV